MMENFNPTPEKINRKEVINILNAKGIEDPEARMLFQKYVDECHQEAETRIKENPDQANLINVQIEVRIALLKAETDMYKKDALEDLEMLYAQNQYSEDEDTRTLAEDILLEIEDLENRMKGL